MRTIAILVGFILQLIAFSYYHYITVHIVEVYAEGYDNAAYVTLMTPAILLTIYGLCLQFFYKDTDPITSF